MKRGLEGLRNHNRRVKHPAIAYLSMATPMGFEPHMQQRLWLRQELFLLESFRREKAIPVRQRPLPDGPEGGPGLRVWLRHEGSGAKEQALGQ